MLVLTRRRQERIQIGDNITLTVVKIKGNSVRLGIEAPRHVRVVRGELPRSSNAADDANSTADPSTSEGVQLFEVSESAAPQRPCGSAGEETGESSRLQDLVAKVRQASTIAHAV